MGLRKVTALCLVLLAAGALAKTKKSDVPTAFNQASYVFVESEDGDIFKPGLFPEDRQAIMDIQDALRDWKRYSITTRRDQADLVFIVRKGRLAGAQLHGGVAGGSRLPVGQAPVQSPGQGPGQSPSRDPGQMGNGSEVGARGEVGPDDDMLRVYQLTPDGKLVGPIWNRTQSDGLDAPQLALFRQLRAAVDKAYPDAAASKQSKP